MSGGARRIEMWSSFLVEAVLRGDLTEARRYAGFIAAARDAELTTPELLAAVYARPGVRPVRS